MKYNIIVIVLFYVIFNSVQGFAQQKNTREELKAFSTKVQRLKMLLEENEILSVKNQWEEIHELIIIEFGLIKDKIYIATKDNIERDRIHYNELLDKQLELYHVIINARNNSFKERELIVSKLHEYSELLTY